MSKKKKIKPGDGGPGRNPVAKFAGKFNKAQTHRDRKNDYKRKPKHTKGSQDPFCATIDKYFNELCIL